jgi:hypothetical protein
MSTRRALVTTFEYREERISRLVGLPVDQLSIPALASRLRGIDRIDGSTSKNPKVA